jgi:hypothetical protein
MAVALELAKSTWSVVLLSRPMALSPATVRFAVFELAFIWNSRHLAAESWMNLPGKARLRDRTPQNGAPVLQ